ncbi:MAG: putative chitinase [Mucilaginibacter sp.]|nr:putative chitinase [Mucilaginibacter sp.]
MNNQQLLQIFPKAIHTPVNFNDLLGKLNDVFSKLGNQTNRSAAFLAQTGYESNSFTVFKENLNYSAQGLMATFPKYFPTLDIANAYARQPAKIANKVYANRMGNGNENSGDGFRYLGRSAIQCTGLNNYTACGQFLSTDFINSPELLEQLPAAIDCAYWYWNKMNLNKYADLDDIKTITKLINGGYNGLDQRTANYNLAKEVL